MRFLTANQISQWWRHLTQHEFPAWAWLDLKKERDEIMASDWLEFLRYWPLIGLDFLRYGYRKNSANQRPRKTKSHSACLLVDRLSYSFFPLWCDLLLPHRGQLEGKKTGKFKFNKFWRSASCFGFEINLECRILNDLSTVVVISSE